MEPNNPAYYAVGLDVDGVVANMAGYAAEKLGLDPEKQTTWDYAPCYGESVDNQFSELLRKPSTWVEVDPFPGAKDAVRLIYTATGVCPVFITSMAERFIPLREWWLREHFGKVLEDQIWVIHSSGSDKPAYAKQQMLTHFVEDKRTTANAMAMAGLQSILIPTRYHNDGDIHPRVQVKSLMEFARDLQTLKEAA